MIIISVVLIIIEKIYPGQNLIDISLASSMAFFVNAIPITPGGIGLGEGSFQIFTYLLTNLDLKFATIFLINRVFYFLSSLVGGLVYLFYKN